MGVLPPFDSITTLNSSQYSLHGGQAGVNREVEYQAGQDDHKDEASTPHDRAQQSEGKQGPESGQQQGDKEQASSQHICVLA